MQALNSRQSEWERDWEREKREERKESGRVGEGKNIWLFPRAAATLNGIQLIKI